MCVCLQIEMFSLWINGVFFVIATFHLTSADVNNHINPPQVYEELHEPLLRTPRHSDHPSSDAQSINFLPPIFNYHAAIQQQDHLKEKYQQQQNSNFQSFKMFPTNHDDINKPAEDSAVARKDDWRPMLGPHYPRFDENRLRLNILHDIEKQMKLNRQPKADLDEKASELVEKTVKQPATGDSKDSNVILIEPNRLQRNFGLQPNVLKNILKNAAPTNNVEITDLKNLIGKEPTYQLEGLHKLLKEPTTVEIKHNGSPNLQINNQEFESLQEQVDALNKARTDALLSAAQQQAEAHIKAQHNAIALLQKNAAKEAYAKIAAHNNGLTILEGNGEPITPASIIVPVPAKLPVNYIASTTSRPNFHAKADCTDQISKEKSAASNHVEAIELPPQYHQEESKNNVQVEEELERQDEEQQEQEEEVAKIEENYSPVPIQHIEYATQRPSEEKQINHLYLNNNNNNKENENDYQQYATKYAFGYHIMDEISHNDFGHEEKRDGKLTKGHYFVHLPDGRTQKVDYYVDGHGYHARVSYDHIAMHPYNARKPEEITDHESS